MGVTVTAMVTATVKASQVNQDSHPLVTVPITVMVTAMVNQANPVTQVSQVPVMVMATETVPVMEMETETVTEMVPVMETVTVPVTATGQVMEPALVQGIFSLGI